MLLLRWMVLQSISSPPVRISYPTGTPIAHQLAILSLTKIISFHSWPDMSLGTGNQPQNLRRGRSLLGREQDVHESGLALFKRRATLRRKGTTTSTNQHQDPKPKSQGCLGDIGPGPKDGWFIYCYLLTCFVPPILLRTCGMLFSWPLMAPLLWWPRVFFLLFFLLGIWRRSDVISV